MIAASSWDTTSALVLVASILAFLAAGIAGWVAYRKVGAAERPRLSIPTDIEDEGAWGPEPRGVRWLETTVLIILGGYIFFDHAFAWVHVPGTPLFISEIGIAVGALVLLGMHTRLGDVLRTSFAARAILLFMSWGFVLLLLALPTWGLDAVRDAAAWYYGIVAAFVLVMMISDARRMSSWLRLFGKAIPWMFLWFPVAIVLDAAFVDRFPTVPDSYVSIVAHRTGNLAVLAAVALGFLWLVDDDSEIFNRRQRTTLTTIATIIILFAAMRNRGGFVAGGVGLFLAFLMIRKVRTNMAPIMVSVAVVLLAIGVFGNIRVKLFAEREVSIDQFLNNIVSVVDRSAGGSRQESTTRWRLEIWGRVIDDVTHDHPIAGFGPGPDLGKRYGITTDENVPLRNPHNSHIGMLARMGFVGIALWIAVWTTWFTEIVRLRRRLLAAERTREAGVAAWLIVSVAAILVNAVFDPTLEGPQVSWLMWGFAGFGTAMVVLETWNRLPALTLSRQHAAKEPQAVTAR